MKACAFLLAFLCLSLVSPPMRGANPFVRGEVNQDPERDLSDVLGIIGYLFLGESKPDCGPYSFPWCGSAQVGSAPSSVIAEDFDRDGFQDLAIANESSHDVSILRGSPQGIVRESSRSFVGENPRSIQAADFTADGILDLITANAATYDVSVLPGRGDSSFQEAVTADFFVGDIPSNLAAADLDGDARADAVTANDDGGGVTLLRGLGDGKFEILERFVAGGNSRVLLLTDLNGDGKPDLVSAHGTKLVVILHR